MCCTRVQVLVLYVVLLATHKHSVHHVENSSSVSVALFYSCTLLVLDAVLVVLLLVGLRIPKASTVVFAVIRCAGSSSCRALFWQKRWCGCTRSESSFLCCVTSPPRDLRNPAAACPSSPLT